MGEERLPRKFVVIVAAVATGPVCGSGSLVRRRMRGALPER